MKMGNEKVLKPEEIEDLLSTAEDWVTIKRTKAESTDEGGSGSGFYGHAGRPGERGGSAPGKDKSAIAYHVSRAEAIESILKDGIDPKYGESWDDRVFVTTSFGDAKKYLDILREGENAVIFKIKIPKGAKFELDTTDIKMYRLKNAYYSKEKIPASWIKGYYPVDAWSGVGDYVKLEAVEINEGEYFIFLKLPSKKKTEGGPGSGFFGHAGRPGQVGGSSSAGGADASTREPESEADFGKTSENSPYYMELPGGTALMGSPDVTVDKMKFAYESYKSVPYWAREGVAVISVHSEAGPETTLDNWTFRAGGNWDSNGEIVNVFNANIYGFESQFRTVIFHEVGHSMFDGWWTKANKEESDIRAAHPDWFDAGGWPKMDYVLKYNALRPFSLTRAIFLDAWDRGEDGITSYSKSWAKHGHFSETVAEMAKILFEDGEHALRETCKASGASNLGDAFLRFTKEADRLWFQEKFKVPPEND